jgi:hypothetical protein
MSTIVSFPAGRSPPPSPRPAIAIKVARLEAERLAVIEEQQVDARIARHEARHGAVHGDDKPLAHRRVPKARARRGKAAEARRAP